MWSALAFGFIVLALGCILLQAFRPKFQRIYGSRAVLHSARAVVLSLPVWLYQWIALVLVLLPIWWISVFAAYLCGTVLGVSLPPTGIFIATILGIYAWYLIRGFISSPANAKFMKSAHADAQAPAVKKKVAVIGAGMAGLVAAKQLKEEGHEVVVFDRTDGWGGVWASSKIRGGRAWGSTLTSTSALNSTLSDSPFPVFHAENGDIPLHHTRQQFMDMLSAYEKRYDVFNGSLRTHTEVTSMKVQEDGSWRVASSHSDGNTNEEAFDAVTVCSGLNHEPWTPPFEGLGTFKGQEVHVNDYDFGSPERLKGKRVLVVGVGETSADVAKDLVDNGVGTLFVAPNRPTITLARAFGSVPPDYPENRFTYAGPMFNRWGILLPALSIMFTNIIKPARVKSLSFAHWMKMARLHETIKDFPTIVGSVNVTKSDNLWSVLSAGQAQLVDGVQAITPEGALLKNNEELKVDAIIYCTGYRTKNNFLPITSATDTPKARFSARDLYKLTIHPDYPNLAFIGFARGMVGAITLSAEMQARWWALLLSGKRHLPAKTSMQEHVALMQRKGSKFSQATRTTMTFANSLARHDVGCEPDLFQLFLKDKKLWWHVWNGAICSSHYRLSGVNAKPELAREQLMMPGTLHAHGYVDGVDVAYNLLPLSVITIPLWALLEKIFPVFFTRSALSSYI